MASSSTYRKSTTAWRASLNSWQARWWQGHRHSTSKTSGQIGRIIIITLLITNTKCKAIQKSSCPRIKSRLDGLWTISLRRRWTAPQVPARIPPAFSTFTLFTSRRTRWKVRSGISKATRNCWLRSRMTPWRNQQAARFPPGIRETVLPVWTTITCIRVSTQEDPRISCSSTNSKSENPSSHRHRISAATATRNPW